MRGRGRHRTRLGRSRIGLRSLTVGGFGLLCAGYDGNWASTPRNRSVTAYPSSIWIGKEKAGDELPAQKKGDVSSRVQASEGPTEAEEKRRVVEKLKERES